jgi:hypothetical protein
MGSELRRLSSEVKEIILQKLIRMKKLLLRRKPKRILRLPDLDHSKTAVLSTLSSPDSQRAYRFAIDDFVA